MLQVEINAEKNLGVFLKKFEMLYLYWEIILYKQGQINKGYALHNHCNIMYTEYQYIFK